MTRLRQTIARRLKEAQNTAAMLTTFNEVDMSAVMDLRKRRRESFKERHGIGLGFMSFFTRAVAEEIEGIDGVLRSASREPARQRRHVPCRAQEPVQQRERPRPPPRRLPRARPRPARSG